MATSHTRFVELEWIMAMPFTQGSAELTHTLITWVLDELGESGRTPSEYLPAPPPFA